MIDVKNLVMDYGSTRALDHVSFQVKEREIVGLLGPNGAGKTTLMRILTTYIYPTEGTALIDGLDITAEPLGVRRLLGYLPETPPLYMDMRVDDYLSFVGRARGLKGAGLKKRSEWVIEATQIADVWKHTVNELSLGYRQRVGLAQALIHDPKVVILDEPTSGLDPMQIIGIRSLIKDLAQTKTIIFSTHILQEASALSDRLVIIDRGRIIADATPQELKSRKGKDVLFTITIAGSKDDAWTALKSIPSVREMKLVVEGGSGNKFQGTATSIDEVASFLSQFVKTKGWVIKEFVAKEPSLEEVFLDLFKPQDK
jgi:ABC-2 type transport system ATP-binding protein